MEACLRLWVSCRRINDNHQAKNMQLNIYLKLIYIYVSLLYDSSITDIEHSPSYTVFGLRNPQSEIVTTNSTIYIYIYIVIHRQICFVLSELISVARQYLPVAGIETRLTQTSNQSF